MRDRTIEEVILLGLKAIEREHLEECQRLQRSHDEYVEMCGAFFDYLYSIKGTEDFLRWAKKNVRGESETNNLSQYIADLSEGRA